MALIATVGGTNTNSYPTIAEANIYFEDRLHTSAWDASEEQAAALIMGSRMLDWYLPWKGYKATESQAMQWPRTEVVRPDGTEVNSAIIPSEVKIAVFELSLVSLSIDRVADNPLAGIEQIKAGSLMIKADNGDADSTSIKIIPDHVKNIVSDLYVRGTLGVVRLDRA